MNAEMGGFEPPIPFGIAVFETAPFIRSGTSPLHTPHVDRVGLEPTTSSMPWRRATNCANGPYVPVPPAGIEPALEA